MVVRKKEKEIQEGDKIQLPRTPPGTYFLQPGPTSYLSPPPNDIII
jgi:hypothetical protein